MRRQRLRLGNFSKGQLRDSATDEERLLSLRTLKNYFIDYSDGRLKVRNGYSRWNDTALDNPAQQLFYFVDLSQNEQLIGIVEDTADDVEKWHLINESGAHAVLKDEIATPRRPVVSIGNRCVFGTDTDLYWLDSNGTAYRLGIARPSDQVTVALAAGQGNIGSFTLPTDAQQAGAPNVGLRLNDAGQERLAMVYTPGADQTIQNIPINFRAYHGGAAGSFRTSIYTGAAQPTTLLNVSDWVIISAYTADEISWVDTLFREDITLTTGTKYWIVLESDDLYKTLFADPAAAGAGNGVYVSFAYTSSAPNGDSLMYDGATWSWQLRDYMATFLLGGLLPNNYYDYRITLLNDTYKSESRPGPITEPSLLPVLATNRVTVTGPTSSDAQVDFAGIYRRDRGDDDTIGESLITGAFEWAGKVALSGAFTDKLGTTQLGEAVSSDDHYLYDDFEDEGGGVRDAALVPAVMTYWKSRLWFSEVNGNILYFSKVQEADGPLALTADSLPDYFPLDNKLEINETSDIIALVPLSADELAVYFRNTSIWVIRGSEDVLNPPADIVLRQSVTDVGLIAPAAVDSLRSRHVFVARKGVYTFGGTSAIEYLSSGIQTILDDIADSSLDDSVVVALGDSVWIAVDEDETGDGKLNNIYILDIQRQPATWRLYNYGISINDMVVRKTGTEYKTLLAADADNNYIVKLEDGNDDNGEAIVAEAETQDLIAPNLATIFEVQIDAYYPNVPPLYEGVVTDAKNEEHVFEIAPMAVDDIAGHRSGLIVPSAIGSRVKITQRTINQNHLRAIDIGFVEL